MSLNVSLYMCLMNLVINLVLEVLAILSFAKFRF